MSAERRRMGTFAPLGDAKTAVPQPCGCVNLIDGGIRWCPLHKNAERMRDMLMAAVPHDNGDFSCPGCGSWAGISCDPNCAFRALLREIGGPA